ncbi:MAG: sugar transferase [Oscillospiraceae bacterium]
MADISKLSLLAKAEIAAYIKEDTLEVVNNKVAPVVPRRSFYTKYGKRFFDIVISLVALIVSAPINAVIAIVTYFDVGSPILFKQQRTGLNEKKFTIYKFRNMTNAVDGNGELLPASERVTKWGKFVRKTSLDELLNFVSILKGDMSIIGPRPLLDRYAERLNDRHRGIYLVRPGLECPTPHRLDHAISTQERLDNYVWYVENCSFLVDLKLCLCVLGLVFDRKNSEERSNAQNGGIIGYDLDGKLIGMKNIPEKYIEKYCLNHGYRDLQEAIDARSGDAALKDFAAT